MRTVMLTRLPTYEGDPDKGRACILASAFFYAYDHEFTYWKANEPPATGSREITVKGTMVVFSVNGQAEPHSMVVSETLDQVVELFTGVPTVESILAARAAVQR